MEHFDEAEGRLREEHDDIADRLAQDVLPAGVTADGKLTYELVAEFEDGPLAAVESVADGKRYPIERAEHDRSGDSSE